MANKKWYQLEAKEVVADLKSHQDTGISQKEAGKRLKQFGVNELSEQRGPSLWQRFLNQFRDFMIIVLLVAALISGLLGEFTDALVIIIVVGLNAVLGVVQENKAEKSLAALKKLAAPTAKVKRDGKLLVIPAREIVPGDIILLEAGDYVPADARLLEAINLKVEEAALTGESVPVEKQTIAITGEAATGDQKNMLFMGSAITYGRGVAVVTNTGMATEIGIIATMIQTIEQGQTPLQQKLEQLGKVLGSLALVICLIMFVLGIMQGNPVFTMFMTAISLAVAAIPEGLPAIVTIVLALGVQKMIKRHAIIRKLPAVETLGAATVICSDKTGTLTQNKMTVEKIYTNGQLMHFNPSASSVANSPEMKLLLTIGTLCNDARLQPDKSDMWKTIGDPTEAALVVAAAKCGISQGTLEKEYPRINEVPFDSERKCMTTIHRHDAKYYSFTKGAPDIILEKATHILISNRVVALDAGLRAVIRRQLPKPLQIRINNGVSINGNLAEELQQNEAWLEQVAATNREMAADALRVLGMAYRQWDRLPAGINAEAMERELVFVGLIGMIDPPRPEVADAVMICRMAGIKPVMITGDHKLTAMAIARKLGILADPREATTGMEINQMNEQEFSQNVERYSVYARVSPEHKVRIVKALKQRGHIVAMTGDGVNDAPALKQADIGAAMGITGTDVAKEAADMVLTDDNFATVVAAVEEGRCIYANIRKCLHFLLSCNIGEILTIFIAILIGLPTPLLPIQILWVNLVTDTLPALALGLDPAEQGIMRRKPRNPNAGVFAEGLGLRIALEGCIIGGVTLTAFILGLRYGITQAHGMAFATLALSQLFHTFNTRSDRYSILQVGLLTNPWLIGANLIAACLQISVITVPFLREIFKVAPLSTEAWIITLLCSAAPLAIVELWKLVYRAICKK